MMIFSLTACGEKNTDNKDPDSKTIPIGVFQPTTGQNGSGCAIAGGSHFLEAKIPAVETSCTNPQVTAGNDYYFRVCSIALPGHRYGPVRLKYGRYQDGGHR